MATTTIKKINVGGTEYEIDAKYWNGHEFSELKNIKFIVSTSAATTPIGVKFTPKGTTTEITGTLAPNAGDKQAIYLVYKPNGSTGDNYAEYIIVDDTVATAAGWEPIGNTGAIDLTNYVQKGTYNTGNGGAGNTGEADLGTATGDASVTYDKSANKTGSAGGATVTFSNATFAGTAATISSEGTLNAVEASGGFVPEGEITGTQALAVHTHSVTTHSHGTNVNGIGTITWSANGDDTFAAGSLPTLTVSSKTVVTGVSVTSAAAATATLTGRTVVASVSHTGGTAPALTVTPTDVVTGVSVAKTVINGTRNYGFSASTSNVMSAPTVSDTGVLSWTVSNAGTLDAHNTSSGSGAVTLTTASIGSASDWSAGSFPTLSYTTTSATQVTNWSGGGGGGAVTLTTTSVGSASGWGAGSLPSFTQGSKASLSYTTISAAAAPATATITTTSKSAGTVDFTKATFSGTAGSTVVTFPTTTISVSASYTPAGTLSGTQSISAHTHSIALTTATASGTASVAIGKHTHTVSNHTHSITFS